MHFLMAFFVAGLANGLLLLVLHRRYEPALFRVLALAYCGTVVLRYSLAIYLWLYHTETQFAQMFWGDSQTYDFFGAAVADGWSQGIWADSWSRTLEGGVNRGFIYFVGALYYLFGRNVLLVQLVNGIIGALTPVVIFEIGLILYDRRVAVTAMLFTAFFPQMIFWSAALYKDPMVMLCIASNILAVFKLRRGLSPLWLTVYLASAGALVWLRFYIFYATAAATAAGMLVRHRRGIAFGLASQLALVAGVIVLLLYTPIGR
ncbi:MAG TPA: glycosyltransferase family 39 protein, partial [Vicinamibacteria bacterium]